MTFSSDPAEIGVPTREEAAYDDLTAFRGKYAPGELEKDPWAKAVENGRFVADDEIELHEK